LKAEGQQPVTVFFRGKDVGRFNADIVVENKVIIELKAASVLSPIHTAQVLNYLKATGLEV
jgi:GxxExxY protein